MASMVEWDFFFIERLSVAAALLQHNSTFRYGACMPVLTALLNGFTWVLFIEERATLSGVIGLVLILVL